LLLLPEGTLMFSVDLSTSERGGLTVVTLRGELDVADAASVAVALTAATESARTGIVTWPAWRSSTFIAVFR
jgi:hypothetical protein